MNRSRSTICIFVTGKCLQSFKNMQKISDTPSYNGFNTKYILDYVNNIGVYLKTVILNGINHGKVLLAMEVLTLEKQQNADMDLHDDTV